MLWKVVKTAEVLEVVALENQNQPKMACKGIGSPWSKLARVPRYARHDEWADVAEKSGDRRCSVESRERSCERRRK